jgi:hypothetical protein
MRQDYSRAPYGHAGLAELKPQIRGRCRSFAQMDAIPRIFAFFELPVIENAAIIGGCTEFCYADTHVWQALFYTHGSADALNAPVWQTRMFANAL